LSILRKQTEKKQASLLGDGDSADLVSKEGTIYVAQQIEKSEDFFCDSYFAESAGQECKLVWFRKLAERLFTLQALQMFEINDSMLCFSEWGNRLFFDSLISDSPMYQNSRSDSLITFRLRQSDIRYSDSRKK
jgi:hypothetical protein